jgi:hypothetical protein
MVTRARPSLFDPEESTLAIFESAPIRTRPLLVPDSEYKPPAYKGSAFEGWARAYIKKNIWRAQAFIDQQDLEQDASVKYWMVCRRYSASLKNGGHLMRLFQRSVVNMITGESRKSSVRIKTVSLEEREENHVRNI